MSSTGELHIDYSFFGGSGSSEFTFSDIEPAPPPPPPPPVSWSVLLWLIDETGTPGWVDIVNPFHRTDFLGTEGQQLLVEGISNTSALIVKRTMTQQDQYVRYASGSATFTLKNLYGAWDPDNELSPWFVDGASLLKQGPQGTLVKVTCTPPGDGTVTRTVFTGRVSSWAPAPLGDVASVVNVVAMDGSDQLRAANLAQLGVSSFAGQSAGQRIDQALERAGWDNTNDDVDITLINSMQGTVFKSDAMTECLNTADSDLGWMFLNKLNGVTYKTRFWPIEATPAVVFSMNAETGTYQYQEGLANSRDTRQTVNLSKQTRDGGIEQAIAADDSTLNGISATEKPSLLMEHDWQAMDTAAFAVGLYRATRPRPTRIPVHFKPTDQAKWETMLDLDLVDTIQVDQVPPHPPGVAERTVSGEVLASGLTWTVRQATNGFDLDIDTVIAPPIYPPALFDDAEFDSAVFAF